ncbi:hypothetical protein [Bacillus cereus group sp. BfR-BA-01426]|uniref:hypothetical protein n=1 Tax=Bacillus cereus group sp. BfR-BA-01426 TaxID=2920343 RepID=UPI001F562AA8
MPRKFTFTEEERVWFDQFVTTDEFAEVLAIVWRYGANRKFGFSVRNKRRWIVARFKELVKRSGSVRHCNFDEDYIYWESMINFSHPLVHKITEMGWSPITEGNRTFPKGSFNKRVFVSTYIRLLHEVGTIREKNKKGIFIRPRLRIHGSVDVLNNISKVLHDELGVGLKKLQTDHKIPQAKTIYFQSKKEIPKILEFAGATESLDKFYSFDLGLREVVTT